MIFNNTSCSLSAQKQIADPVVYKLVRLEGDGRLVPATDDDFVEVENLLEDDNGELNIVENPGSSPNEELSSRKPEFVGLEGSLHLQNTESEAKNSNMELEVLSLLEMASNQSVTVAECSNHSDELENNETSTSDVYVKPDFSKLKEELCLDNLSIRELHQTFKATFGRETSVKDKLWLKRRIAMGLTNSCNVSTTTFTIKDNRLVKTGDDESCHKVHNPSIVEISTDSPANQVNQIVHHNTISFKRARNPKVEHDCKTEDHNTENKAAKRARKPTRRYIEELSEGEGKEYSGRSMLTVNKSGYCQSSLKSPARSARNASSDGRAVVTRLDSLGGSGVQVPYVSRVRRGRPRENFMSLSKFHPSGRVAATSLKKAFNIGSAQPDNDSGNKVSKASSVPQQQLLVTESGRDGYCSDDNDVQPKRTDSSWDCTSDDNVVTVPTAKGGIRRKHHRAWTLSEVIKLVDGVSRYGPGRWSEIKRLAFASYAYRTSVDLKDKWRNLLRATLAETPSQTGMKNFRKQVSTPIPAPILSRVRELAQIHAQTPSNQSSSKPSVCSDGLVHEMKAGFL